MPHEALQDYETAIMLDPNDASDYLNRAAIYEELGAKFPLLSYRPMR